MKELLGDDKFSEALHFFINNWKGKHPSPYDFFNCINTQSGQNLNWFWKDWFLNKIAPDLAIRNVSRKGSRYIIEIKRAGNGIVPIHLKVIYQNGTQQLINKDISCWSQGNDVYMVKLKSGTSVSKIILGSNFDVDIDASNNIWESKE